MSKGIDQSIPEKQSKIDRLQDEIELLEKANIRNWQRVKVLQDCLPGLLRPLLRPQKCRLVL